MSLVSYPSAYRPRQPSAYESRHLNTNRPYQVSVIRITMPITTTTTLPAPVQLSFNAKLLSVPTPNMIHNLAAMKSKMPAQGGTVKRYRRYNPLQPALVPLGNSGVTPPSQQLTAVDIDAKIQFYGTYIQLNEQVTLQAQDAPLNEAARRLGVSLNTMGDNKLNLNTLENLRALA